MCRWARSCRETIAGSQSLACMRAESERWNLWPHMHGGLFQTASIFPQLCDSGLAPAGRGHYLGVVAFLIAAPQTRRATLSRKVLASPLVRK